MTCRVLPDDLAIQSGADNSGTGRLATSFWPIEYHLRSYLFFFTNAHGKSIFRAVDEYLDAPAAAKP